MFRGLVVIGGEGRGWLDSFVSCQPGSNLARAICLYPEEGWRLDSTAAPRSQPPRSLAHSCLLSLSLSSPRRSHLRSASLRTAWPGTLFTLPAKWSLSGLSIWLISLILPAFLCKRRKKLSRRFNLTREKGRKEFYCLCRWCSVIVIGYFCPAVCVRRGVLQGLLCHWDSDSLLRGEKHDNRYDEL